MTNRILITKRLGKDLGLNLIIIAIIFFLVSIGGSFFGFPILSGGVIAGTVIFLGGIIVVLSKK